jgi:hypothetical protein
MNGEDDAFFHDTDFDSRIRELFKISKAEADALPVDPQVMGGPLSAARTRRFLIAACPRRSNTAIVA